MSVTMGRKEIVFIYLYLLYTALYRILLPSTDAGLGQYNCYRVQNPNRILLNRPIQRCINTI